MTQHNKQLSPGFLQTDWYLLRGLVSGIRAAIDILPFQLKEKKIIDYGCGSSPYRSLFENAGANYVGIDVGGTPDLLIKADENLPLPDHHADMVVSFQVLEHVKDITLYLKEAHRILKMDGFLLLSTHGTWLYHPHPQDFRRWTRDGLIMEIADSGFEIKKVWPVAGPLAWTSMLRLTGFAFVLRSIPILGKLVVLPLIFLMNCRIWLEDSVTPRSMVENNACVYLVLASKKSP